MLENAWYGNIWMHFKRWSWATTRGRAGETPRSSLLETLLMAPLMMSSGRVLKGLDPFGLIIMKVWFYLKLGNISPPLKLGRCLSVMAGLSRLMWWLTRTLALFMSTLAWVRTPFQKHHVLEISWFFVQVEGRSTTCCESCTGPSWMGTSWGCSSQPVEWGSHQEWAGTSASSIPLNSIQFSILYLSIASIIYLKVLHQPSQRSRLG